MGISLWIVPPPKERITLKQFMANVSGAKLPLFDPHITLGTFPSPTPVGKLRACVPALTDVLRIQFASVKAGDHYFRSVFVAIEPTRQLELLHEHAHSALGLEAKTPMFPHMSLLYVPDEMATERQTILEGLVDDGRVTATERGVALVVDDACVREGDGRASIGGFDASEVWIVLCDGPVDGWRILETVPLCPLKTE